MDSSTDFGEKERRSSNVPWSDINKQSYSVEIRKKSKAQKKKFKNKWDKIIQRYSAFSEDDQGDVIDLATGEIIEDKGHLRSLKTTPSEEDIWGEFYDFERDAKNQRRREYTRNSKLKPLHRLLSVSRSQTSLELLRNPTTLKSYQDNLLLLKPTVSPTKSITKLNHPQATSNSNNSSTILKERDDILLLSPSISRTGSPSPTKNMTNTNALNSSRLFDLSSIPSSPIKNSSFHNNSSPLKSQRFSMFSDSFAPPYDLSGKSFSSPLKPQMRDTIQQHTFISSPTKSDPYNDYMSSVSSAESETSDTDVIVISDHQNSSYISTSSHTDGHSLEEDVPGSYSQNRRHSVISISSNSDSYSSGYSSESICYNDQGKQEDMESFISPDNSNQDIAITYDISLEMSSSDEDESIDDSTGYGHVNYASHYSWTCPFPNCTNISKKRKSLKTHIEKLHPSELTRFGYLVSSNLGKYKIQQELQVEDVTVFDKLKDMFPLVNEVPPLPDGEILRCPNSHCSKWFVKKSYLKRHIQTAELCSKKRTKLVCPVLGCIYKSHDYMNFREHFILLQHHIHPNHRSKVQ